MKKFLCMMLAIMMFLAMASTAFAADYKIAILTGTVSQGDEEFRAAAREKAADPDGIVTDTYPDNFMAETETTISKLLNFAADPDVKAIVMCQAVPGAKAGFDKIREMGRDDILLIAGTPQEDPDVISAAADIVLYADEVGQGDSIMATLEKWGVDVFVHYSFPRHMAMELIVARHEKLVANAAKLGIEFVDATAPDPTAEAGISASQQFILEDVPRKMEQYAGKKVAFFTTNCGMQEPLQTAVLKQPLAYYPQPCCPSPYHGYLASLGLEIPEDKQEDDEYVLQQSATKLAAFDAVGRFSTWPSPIAMTMIEVGTAYARAYVEGQITERNDAAKLNELFAISMDGKPATIANYTSSTGVTYDNYYTVLLSPVDYNDFLVVE